MGDTEDFGIIACNSWTSDVQLFLDSYLKTQNKIAVYQR